MQANVNRETILLVLLSQCNQPISCRMHDCFIHEKSGLSKTRLNNLLLVTEATLSRR